MLAGARSAACSLKSTALPFRTPDTEMNTHMPMFEGAIDSSFREPFVTGNGLGKVTEKSSMWRLGKVYLRVKDIIVVKGIDDDARHVAKSIFHPKQPSRARQPILYSHYNWQFIWGDRARSAQLSCYLLLLQVYEARFFPYFVP